MSALGSTNSSSQSRGTGLASALTATALSIGLGWLVIHSAASGRITLFVAASMIAGIVAVAGRRDFTRPEVLLPVIWFGGVALAQLNLLPAYQTPWSATMIIVAFSAPAAFAAGSLVVGGGIARPRTPVAYTSLATTRLRASAFLLLLIGLAGITLKARLTGGFALFSNEIDSLRSAGGIHVPAWVTMMTDCLFLSLWCSLLTLAQRRPATERVFDAALAALAFGGVSLSASRNTLLIAVAIPVIFMYLARGARPISPGRVAAIVAVALLITVTISGLFFVRTGQHRQSRFESSFYTYVVPRTPTPLRPLLPFYISLTAPLETLNRTIRRSQAASAQGTYSVPGIPPAISPFGPRADFYAFSGAISHPYYFNVATYAGPPYLDGRLPLVLATSLLLGLLVGAARRWALAGPTPLRLAVLAYVTYLVGFLVYENLLAVFTISVVFDVLVVAAVMSWSARGAQR